MSAGALSVEVDSGMDEESDLEADEAAAIAQYQMNFLMRKWSEVGSECVRTEPSLFEL